MTIRMMKLFWNAQKAAADYLITGNQRHFPAASWGHLKSSPLANFLPYTKSMETRRSAWSCVEGLPCR